MTDPFRGGSFGSVGMGPFTTGGGGDSRYLIADDGDQVALTRKYGAQIRWANGTITDSEYLAELMRYLKTTDKGSRERTSAQNEYDDAVYTIGRNRLVRAVNNASSASLRVAGLRRLIAYDARKLATMRVDNEQYRELADRMDDARRDIRSIRYGELVRRFNRNAVGIAAMLQYARQAAAASRGDPDAQEWRDRVVEWQQRADNERLSALYQDFEHDRIPGSTVVDFLKGMLARMDPDSPAYKDTQRSIEDLIRRVHDDEMADRDARMASRVANGSVSNTEYLAYLRGRINDYDQGTRERRQARDAWLSETFRIGEDAMRAKLEAGTIGVEDAAAFYRSHMATMDPSSARFLELQQVVSDLLVRGTTTLALFPDGQGGGPGGYAGGGRWVDLSGAPGGTPVNAQGYASQFDGSAFASSNCGMASAAMLAWAATDGRVRVSGGDLRYYSGDRDRGGDEAGTTYDDITRAFQNIGLGLQQHHGMSFEAWKRRLARGEGSLISGAYSVVPSNLSLQPGYGGAHTMYVDRAKKINGEWFFFVMDPLGRSGYSGRWWPEAAIRAYGWSGIGNAGGGTWFGDVAFATRRGRSSTFINPDRDSPSFQAFDTDWEGRSTIGRGGGTSRREAGRRRDWSDGRQNEPRVWDTDMPTGGSKPGGGPKAVTDEQVSEFLAAVSTTANPNVAANPADRATFGLDGTMAEKEARARALLGEYGGDARLAAVAWFTGSADPDTAAWGPTERFYANAVATRLGYEPVPRGGIGVIDPMLPPSPLDLTTAGRDTRGTAPGGVEAMAPEAGNIARMLLAELGVPATPDMVRAVDAWIATEGGTVRGNNPAVLRTNGTGDLAGQIGKDEDGLAVFGSLEEGVAAWAEEIRRSTPGIIAAARSGDAERFLVAVDRSGWVQGGYQGTLIRTFNELPGEPERLIIGGNPGLLRGASGLRSLAGQEPGIAELFDIDPRDPIQMAWLDANLSAARDALDDGATTWGFTTPGGQVVQLDLAPSMVTDLAHVKATYLDWTVSQAITPKERQTAARAAADAHAAADSLTVEVAYDEWGAHMEALDALRQASLGMEDYATYLNATLRMADATSRFLGTDPAAGLDIDQSPVRGMLTETQRSRIASTIDSLEPRDTTDPNAYNPDGDEIVELWQKGYIGVQRDSSGNIVGATPDPSAIYRVWNADGSIGRRTILKNPADFELTAGQETFADGTPVMVPRYTLDNAVVSIDGATAYAPIGSADVVGRVLTAAGYRTAVLPATAGGGMTTPWSGTAHPGQMVRGDLLAPRSGVANIAPWLLGGTTGQQAQVIDPSGREDRQMVTVTQGGIPVQSVSVYNRRTGEMEVWYSIPGTNQWLGGTQDDALKNAPTVVLDGATFLNGRLTIGGDPYDPASHGSLAKYAHWYGTSPTDGAGAGELGATDTYWRLRQALPAPGGGVLIDSAPSTPQQAFLEGDIPYLYERWGNTSAILALGAAAARERAAAGEQAATGTTGATPEGADVVARVTAEIRASFRGVAVGGMTAIPMNAGATEQPRPTSIRSTAGLMGGLAAGVRAMADQQAAAIAAMERSIAAQQAAVVARQAWEAKLQQRLAEQRAAQQAALRPTTTPQPTTQPKPTLTPEQKAWDDKLRAKLKPTPEPTPEPTPTPTPAPNPLTYGGPGSRA